MYLVPDIFYSLHLNKVQEIINGLFTYDLVFIIKHIIII